MNRRKTIIVGGNHAVMSKYSIETTNVLQLLHVLYIFTCVCLLLISSGCSDIKEVIGPPLPKSRATKYLQSLNTSSELIKKLVNGSYLSPTEIEFLMSCDDYNVRHLLAGNTFIPLDIMVKLANDKSDFVRAGVAGNMMITLDLVEKLQFDKGEMTIKYLVRNPMLPEDYILKIYHRRGRYVGLNPFAGNPYCPKLIQQAILKSNDKYAHRQEWRWRNDRLPQHMKLIHEYENRNP